MSAPAHTAVRKPAEGSLGAAPVLFPWQKKVFASLTEALLSNEDDNKGIYAPPKAAVAAMVEEMDLLIASASPDLSRGFVALAFLIEWLPLFFVGSFSRASRLSLPLRVRYLQRLEHSRFGIFATLLVALKLPISLIAFEQEDLLASTGFDRGTISGRRKL